jgi:enoyl-CoA hydratase/carnithine racemase
MDLKAAPAYRFITLEHADGGNIAVVTMNRPEKRNALSLEVMRELTAAFRAIGAQRQAYAVILRGEGPAFSAGHDLSELQCRDVEAYREIFDVCVELMQSIQSIPQPVIAEVQTVATAAGCQLVATCDLALAGTGARFATPGVRIGLFCSTPMVALSRNIGRKRAMEMLLTGEFIDARTAAEWGLVNRVVEPEQLHAEALALARKIGEASRMVVGLGKSAFYRQIDLDQAGAYGYAKEVMAMNAMAADAQEGIGAFLEKRVPTWRD